MIPKKPTKRLFSASNKVLALLCAMSLIFYIDRVNVATSGTVFGKEFGFSNTQLGFIFSVYAYPYFVLQILGGWLGDRIGPRRTLTICSFIWSTATVACGFATGFTSLVIARILLGIGEGAALPTSTRAQASWVPVSRRGFAQGITHAFSRLGNAIAPPLVSWLVISKSWRASFIIVGIASFIWVLIWAYYFRDNPKDHPGITDSELETLEPHVDTRLLPPVPWKILLKRMTPVAITYFCYGWVLWLYLTWLPSYFIHQKNLNLKNSALFSGGVFFAGVVGDWLGGEVTDKWAKRTGNLRAARCYMTSICMVLTATILIPLLAMPDLSIGLVAMCLSFGLFFNEMAIGPMWCVPMDISGDYSGTASGIMNAGGAVAAMLSPVVSGFLIDKTLNWNAPFYLAIGITYCGAILAFTMRPEKRMIVPGLDVARDSLAPSPL